MGIVVVPTYGSDPATVNAANLDAKVAGLATEFNGNIDNDNIDASAAIANSKLNLATITQNITHSGTMTHSGTLTMTAKDISEAKGADVASATTTTIWVTDGNYIHITGTTTITSFGTAGQAGDERTIIFDDALTLTHNSTTLKLPGGANITTAAGDRAIVRADTTANAIVTSYTKASGLATVVSSYTPTAANALAGSVVQTVSTYTRAVQSVTATSVTDDSIPTTSETGNLSNLDRAITPNSATNRLIIEVTVFASAAGAAIGVLGLTQDAGTDLIAVTGCDFRAADQPSSIKLTHEMAAGTTSATTFKVWAGNNGGSQITMNGLASTGGRLYGGVASSCITIREIKV